VIRQLNPHKNKINFSSESLESLIDWSGDNVFEPSLTKNIPTCLVEKYINMEEEPPRLVFDHPCHTQGVERYVPLLIESTNKVAVDQQQGYILAKLKARNLNPNF
jgi:hypothetical protein